MDESMLDGAIAALYERVHVDLEGNRLVAPEQDPAWRQDYIFRSRPWTASQAVAILGFAAADAAERLRETVIARKLFCVRFNGLTCPPPAVPR